MKQAFKKLRPYMKDYYPQFGLSFLGNILFALGTASTAYLIKPILDEIFITKDEHMLYTLPFIVVVVYFFKGIGRFMGVYFTSYIGGHIVHRLRSDMLGVLLDYDIDLFYKTQKGELISRISSDTLRISRLVSDAMPMIVREFFTTISLLGVVIYQSPKLAFFALIVLPGLAFPLSILARRMKRFSHKSQNLVADLTSRLNEIFHNIEIIKTSNAQKHEHERFVTNSLDFFKIDMKMVKTNELVGPLMELAGAIGVAAVIIVGGLEVIHDKMSVGTFFSFVTALFMVYTPIKSLMSQFNRLQDAAAASERIFDYLALRPTIKDGKKTLENVHCLEIRSVGLNYGDTQALKNINLVNNKETIALVGQSGGGKSSLVSLLVRFFDPSEGEILINNTNIKEFSLSSLRDKIAFVTQKVFIFASSVSENVAYGKEIDEKRVIDALQKANAYDFVMALPDGINTKLDEGGANLSGGQKQRIAIARAFYKSPQILILDEATSALDNESEKLIKKSIKTLAKDKFTFIVAHRLSTIEHAKKIALLKNGQIVCFGDEAELLRSCDEYKTLKDLS